MKVAWILPYLALILALAPGVVAAPAEPSDYRMEDYAAATPATLSGASVLTTDQVQALWEKHQAVFIDVLPRVPRPAGLPASTLWRPKPRFDIPDSTWLPDTGYGALAPVMETYFKDGLRLATSGDADRMTVFYCKADCWMSWNAARRAMTLGYRHVGWYPEGIDGWLAHGLPTEPRQPVPRPDVTE